MHCYRNHGRRVVQFIPRIVLYGVVRNVRVLCDVFEGGAQYGGKFIAVFCQKHLDHFRGICWVKLIEIIPELLRKRMHWIKRHALFFVRAADNDIFRNQTCVFRCGIGRCVKDSIHKLLVCRAERSGVQKETRAYKRDSFHDFCIYRSMSSSTCIFAIEHTSRR